MAREGFWRYSEPVGHISIMALSWGFGLERAKGIEPSYAAWEAAVLPLNYARARPLRLEDAGI